MADLGLPRSLWACYEAWQNNSDRWWQMSLRARLRVGAHANETNETLCVSFSPCACTPKACANRNTHRHIKTFTGMTPANQNKEKFFLKRWRLNPSLFSDGFRHHWHTFPFFQKKQNKKKTRPPIIKTLASSFQLSSSSRKQTLQPVMLHWLVLIESNFNTTW